MRRSTILIIALFEVITIKVMAQNVLSADSAIETEFAALNDIFSLDLAIDSLYFSRDSTKNALFFKTYQNKYALFRERGLQFWNKYPKDARRYQWLVKTVQTGHFYHYWKDVDIGIRKLTPVGMQASYNVPIDWSKLCRWELLYPKLKSDFIKHYKQKPTELKGAYYDLLIGELSQFLSLSLNLDYRKSTKIDLVRLTRLFLATSEILLHTDEENDGYSNSRTTLTNLMDHNFLAVYKQYGLTDPMLLRFINTLKKNDNDGIQKWAIQRSALLALKKTPFQLKHNDIDGREVDLEKLRGKVVLVDFWTTWCSSCIARMPAIKKVYDKYKNSGFEVISVSLNAATSLDEVKKVKMKVGADWPTLIVGFGKNDLGKKIWDRYGFSGVPQLLLLNKKGELIILNDELRYGNFEPVVKRLLMD